MLRGRQGSAAVGGKRRTHPLAPPPEDPRRPVERGPYALVLGRRGPAVGTAAGSGPIARRGGAPLRCGRPFRGLSASLASAPFSLVFGGLPAASAIAAVAAVDTPPRTYRLPHAPAACRLPHAPTA
ncbi:hypothetical protein SSP531S_27140 [Streptomyces spongiicola]|uniref:Uncharacterized protein n=1 Tax=Streptomyces spongiicola TaxID=1690221 RepID=A0A388SZK6_9ACTN|nr:hypothetical protein SSP531S_27140 [Streptomyces spongiicola]